MCPKAKLISAVLIFLASFCVACDNSEFRKQIGDFRDAMSNSRSAVETYYQEMNRFERDIYLIRRELDPMQDLGIIYSHEEPEDVTMIVNDKALYVNGPFAPASIQARLDSLKLIGIYGNRLAELAGSPAPAIFADNATALGQNIAKLGDTFQKLGTDGKDKSAASFAGPVGKLVGIVGQLFLQRKRDKELIAAIRVATPEITAITKQLSKDFDEVVLPTKRTGVKATIALLVNHYNVERAKPNSTRKDRKSILAEIDGAVRTYELLTAANPKETIQSMEDANQALLAYANSGHKDADFSQLVARIAEFKDRATSIIEAVQEIREIRRSLRDANGQ